MTRLTNKTITVQKTIGSPTEPKVSFRKQAYDSAIEQKGYDVIYEKAVRCPCKSRNSGNQSNCKNCGATGWVFINPSKTKMIVQAMSLNPQYKDWGLSGAEVSSVTARDIDKLSFMDRITVQNAFSELSETLHFSLTPDSTRLYSYTVYPIKGIYYVGMFESVLSPLLRLVEGTDFTVSNGNMITLSEALSNRLDNDDISATIRYKHNPLYHIIEVVRDAISSTVFSGQAESIEQLPLHARAKKADLIKDIENFSGDRLLDNSFEASTSCKETLVDGCV